MSNPASLAPRKLAAPVVSPVDRLKAFWESRTPRQRVYLGVGAAVTIATAVILGTMMSTPTYKPLMSGLEPADTQTITSQLAAKKIPYTVSPDGGTISVSADQLDAARLEVASHDSPKSGRIGYEIFDKTSWGQTEFDEKVNYQRALEGELERTIQTMSNVKAARVHLVLPTDSVFIDRARSAKASVTLRLKGGNLSREEIAAITRLVAGAVEELKPQDVTIVDADSNRTLTSANSVPGGDDEEAQDLTKRLIATLAPIVGEDRIHATVNVEHETNSSEENQEKYDPQVSVPLNMQRSEETSGGGATVGGVPGTSSNIPGNKQKPQAASDPDQSSKTESATYGVNRVTRHTIAPAGGIRRITAAVVVDDVTQRHQEKGKWVETRQKRSPEELKLISDLAQAAIGFNTTRGDVISVQNLAFDRPEPIDTPAPTFVERTRKNLNEYATLARYGVMLLLFGLVYLLMIRPIQKRALASIEAAPADELPAPPMEAHGEHESASEVALRSLELRKQLSEFVQKEPETSTTALRAWLREDPS